MAFYVAYRLYVTRLASEGGNDGPQRVGEEKRTLGETLGQAFKAEAGDPRDPLGKAHAPGWA
jgi:hypothetical protein